MSKIKSGMLRRIVIGDGAMGTMLLETGPGQVSSAEMNIIRPELVSKIHELYARAGATFLTSNTFSASPLRLGHFGLAKKAAAINNAAVRCARIVASRFSIPVAGNIGPSGELLEPSGTLDFRRAAANFRQQALFLKNAGVDFFLLETFTDLLELKAAIAGVSSVSFLPIFATFSFTQEDRLLNGSDAAVAAATVSSGAIAALGANCGTSLENMKLVAGGFLRHHPGPIIIQPNAEVAGGEGVEKRYSPAELADFFEELVTGGVTVIGSCCGSTPDHTAELAKRFSSRPVARRSVTVEPAVCSERRRLGIAPRQMILVGERINPAGRKKLQDELLRGSLFTVRREAVEQQQAGAQVLDINLNIPDLELETVKRACWSLQNLSELPLAIDSGDDRVIRVFLENYRGKALINSVSAERHSLKKILPLAREFNCAFVASPISASGIPSTAKKRVALAGKIFAAALRAGIAPGNVIFDPLVSNLASEPSSVAVTIETIRLLRKTYPENSIIIGLSNISFGLPNRELLNASFLALAAAAGANIVIANPLAMTLRNAFHAARLLCFPGRESMERFLQLETAPDRDSKLAPAGFQPTLREAILNGDSYNAGLIVKELLGKRAALDLIKEEIVPVMNEVGDSYQRKELFLPHLIAAADTVKAVFPLIREKLPREGSHEGPRVLLATVRGDVHDIGKNIVAAILQGFNLPLIDAGKDVPAERIVELARSEKAEVIGLSSLMSTTVPALEKTVHLIRSELPRATIFIGGAVITEALARKLDVCFATDGMAMIAGLRRLGLLN